jgi:hypothetical protein
LWHKAGRAASGKPEASRVIASAFLARLWVLF